MEQVQGLVSGSPEFSVVVAIVSDTTDSADTSHLIPCLDALLGQSGAPAMEIIVPYHAGVQGISEVESRYSNVRFLKVADLKTYSGRKNSREHHDELRARGLAVAQGTLAALIEDCGIAAKDWVARMVEAHRQPMGGAGGAMENGIDMPLNWAVYYCDFLRYQQPLQAGDAWTISDANCCYKRAALEGIGSVWREVFHESSINDALRAKGDKVILAPAAVVSQHRLGLTLGSALKERYVWGRSYAASRAKLATAGKRLFWGAFSPALPALMLTRMTLMAWKKRRTWGAFVKAFPLTAMLIVSWAGGEFIGYLTGRPYSGGEAGGALVRGSSEAA
jgi:hypothetical protein